MKALLVAGALLLPGVAVFGAEPARRIEDYFPEKFRDHRVRRRPLAPEKREYLKKLGVPDRTLDMYGDVFVKGYGADGLRWGDLKPDDLGPIKVVYDTTGMRKLPPLPPTGHPRLFFTDAERREHRERLENSRAGQMARKIMNCCVAVLKGTFDQNADYARPDILKGAFGSHGFMPIFRYGDRSGKAYRNYSQGRAIGKLNLGLLAVEAYRCWVYDDSEAALLAAQAFATACRRIIEETPKDKRPGLGFNGAFCYDLLYNAMTPEQRRLAHGIMIISNYDNNQYGCFQDAIATTSNWTTFSYRIYSWLALEGEPGYNDLMYRGYVRGLHNFLTYGWFKRGPCWEGMGKNQLGGEIAYVMTRRGDKLAGHPHLLANLREYMPHAIVPWGGAYIAYDLLGGVRLLNVNDILPLKFLFPRDRRIDWVYRNAVFEDFSFAYRNVHAGYWADNLRVEGWSNSALHCILFLSDYLPDNNDPAKLGLAESFFGPQRGLMITRSSWKKDAAYLQHHCRGASGGHVFADRNNIVFGALGRMWIVNGSRSFATHRNNVVTIDDWTQKNGAPGRMVDYRRTPLATFSCGDAKPAYEWEYKSAGKWGEYTLADAREGRVRIPAGWEKNLFCFNDFAFEKDPRPPFTMPYFERPDWLQPGKITAQVRRRRPGNTVNTAFRTAGLVRGPRPYALIVDDYTVADDREHRFTWNARVPTDVVLVSATTYWLNTNGKPVPKNKTGDRRVSVLTLMGAGALTKLNQYGGYDPPPGTPACQVIFIQQEGRRDLTTRPRIEIDGGRLLRVSVLSREPKFKVLLVPYLHRRTGGPKLSFTAAGKLQVDFGVQQDLLTFQPRPDGRTGIQIERRAGPRQPAARFSFGME